MALKKHSKKDPNMALKELFSPKKLQKIAQRLRASTPNPRLRYVCVILVCSQRLPV